MHNRRIVLDQRIVLDRRLFTSGLLAAPVLLGSRAIGASDIDIAIVGAGAAGLMAAARAKEMGLSARIFEARARVGGRVFTDASLGPAFDAGAFYIHFAERNPWRRIAEEFKAETIDDDTLWGSFGVYRHGAPVPAEERARRRGAFGRMTAAMEQEEAGADLSFAAAARRYAPELLEAAASLTLLSLGEDPERVSLRDYQRLDSGDDLVLPGGYGRLLERYARGLDIALSTPVTTIDTRGSGVRLETAKGALTARAAIVTVPIGVLQAGAIRFLPALPGPTQAAIGGLHMGALTKVALRIDGSRLGLAPWSQIFDQGAADTAGDLVNFEFWPFERDLVLAYFGGDFARGLAKAGEAAAVDAMTARLVAILGKDAGKAITGGRLAGWSADPWALGGYSIAAPGEAGARAALETPVAERLYFAGEANAGVASMTAGGAALAGRRAVEAIARTLGR